jgi:hypothetical protein
MNILMLSMLVFLTLPLLRSGRPFVLLVSLPQQAQAGKQNPDAGNAARLPRGKKLVLKDGTFQIVRSYERNGDRVKYFSLERGGWEEIPTALVDWDATAKAETAAEQEDEALVSKIHKQEEANIMQTPLDIDASLQVAPSVFLPEGEGMFLLQGKHITKIEQNGAREVTEKKKVFAQIISPVKIVPGRQNIQLVGTHATVRTNFANGNIEFYLREAPPDPQTDSKILRTSRQGDAGPNVELVQATIKGNTRRLESMKTFYGIDDGRTIRTVSIQRWEVAPGVFRFTLSASLPPGEYALAEVLPDGMNMYVWDFGVDKTAAGKN